ncbi:MAG: MaoC family dehydratase [Aquincola sp.]|nr:MaoC family dehydratase [Aquincola sp.]MDH4290016.1 MaoC family dehydratase [Aquincola sp.]
MKRFARLSDLAAHEGREFAASGELLLEQSRIDAFATVTDDRQWIHVDPVRAASGPFGVTIAHGFLTLSLLPKLMHESFAFDDVRMGVNYGINRVRFPSPVPVGSALRARFKLLEFEPIDGGAQLTVEATVERSGHAKPVCVAELVTRQYT